MAPLTVVGRLDAQASGPATAVRLLRAFAATLMILPADMILKPVGATGYAAALVADLMFLAWIAVTFTGAHAPLASRYPARVALGGLWVTSLLSYALMNRAMLTTEQQAAADRWLIQLAGVSGVILVSAEFLTSAADIRRVLRALTWGGAFCGVVALLQFKLRLDITPDLRIPGFSLNVADAANVGIGSRSGLNRVPGTATDPIELGVVAGMLLPLATFLAIHDVHRTAVSRWLPVLCVAIAIPASVSRSAILSATIALGVFIVSLPPARRLAGLAMVPLAAAAVFVTAHGLIGTLTAYFTAGTGDSSVAHRVNNYALVEHLVSQAPWLGQGGGTYIVKDATYILDNQYLTTAIELGLAGLAALAFFLIWPAIAALYIRNRTADPQLRDLCAALAGAALAGAVCSATFDSFSFPMFVSVQALVAGLTGAAWLAIERERHGGT